MAADAPTARRPAWAPPGPCGRARRPAFEPPSKVHPVGACMHHSHMIDALALVTAVVLLAIAGLHVYWAAGGQWPGHDAASLNALVVGSRPGASMPPRFATLAVSAGISG